MNDAWVFTMADQERFARLSGDWNPIHVDPLAARRTQAGQVVVHGVHGVLRALETLARGGTPLADARSLRVQFSKFIFLDRPVRLRVKSESPLRVALVGEDDLVLASLTIDYGPRKAAEGAPSAKAGVVLERPLSPEVDDIAAIQGALAAPAAASGLAEDFPALTQALGLRRVEGLALLSTLVGMACPGLHSIFSSIKVDFVEEEGGALSYRVAAFDQRFGLIAMDVRGCGLVGKVEAFRRQPPAEGEPIAALMTKVTAGEFAHVRALILGGSRGLGAASAKLIAAGGGQAVVTYARGAADAEAVCAEINAQLGKSVCAAASFDLGKPVRAQLAAIAGPFTHMLYFATPQIARQKSAGYSPELMREFVGAYVDSFNEACQALVEANGALKVLYPSTVFVEERPQGMTEYAMAKAAGEQLCADLARANPKLTISAPRLPRVMTDQNASVTPTEMGSPGAIMLPLLRALG